MASQAYVINARLAVGLSTLLCWVCIVALAAVVVTHQPHNHIALDIRVCYVLGGLAAIASALGRVGGALGPVWVYGTLISGLSLIVFVFVLDHWSLVVGYELLARAGPTGVWGDPVSESRASVLGGGAWVLVFVTVPLALAVAVFPIVWASSLAAMYQDLGSALPTLTQWMLDGLLMTLWGTVALAVVVVASVTVQASVGVRRGMLVAALLWTCLGVAVTWLAVYLPLYEMTESVGY